MTFFANSVLNIILTLFNSIMTDEKLAILCLAVISETIMGMYYTYCLVKNKTRFPIIYLIPIVREIAIATKKCSPKVDLIRFAGNSTFLIAAFSFIVSLATEPTKEIAYVTFILFFISTLCYAIINCYFFVTTSECNQNYFNALSVIMLYFFPALTLAYFYDSKKELDEKRKAKKKRPQRIIANILTVAILANTLVTTSIQAQAADLTNHYATDDVVKVGCSICDNTDEKIVLPIQIVMYPEETVESYCAITCKECEVFHVVGDNLNKIPYDYSPYDSEYLCAFFDFSNTKYSTGDNYNAISFTYNKDKHYALLDNCFVDGKLGVKEKFYTQGLLNGYYNENLDKVITGDAEYMYSYFLTDQKLQTHVYESYWEGDTSFTEASNNAVEFYPKNKDFHHESFTSEETTVSNEKESNNSISKTYVVDNTNTKDYTSNNNESYDNSFNVDNFLDQSLEKSLIAVATTGTLALLSAVASPAIMTIVAAAGTILTATWLIERGYQLFELYTRDYSCKEEQEAAAYRYLETTTSDLVGLFTGSVCCRLFGGLVNKSNEIKNEGKLIDAQNALFKKLDYQKDYNNYKDAFDLAKAIKENGNKPTDNMMTKEDFKNIGWKEGKAPSNYSSKSVGGNEYGNKNGALPIAKGRKYYEADCGYVSGKRNSLRIVWSNDGDYYYTDDHYVNFMKLEGF